MMRIVDVHAVPVRAGFFFDDQLVIRAGAGHDGFDYTGAPRIPGFRREGLMIVGNEMARTAALVRAREAAPHARV